MNNATARVQTKKVPPIPNGNFSPLFVCILKCQYLMLFKVLVSSLFSSLLAAVCSQNEIYLIYELNI